MSVSNDLYQNLIENSSGVKRQISLERLKEACDKLEKPVKAAVYTIADVGRFCERMWGGPKTQSIRNSPEVLERYVKVRIGEFTEKSGPRADQTSGGKKQLNLAEPAVAQQQYMLALAEIEQLRAEVSRLKADVSRYAPMTTDQLIEACKLGGPSSVVPPEEAWRISPDAIKAIDTLLDTQRLKACELTLDHGHLVNEVNGNVLLAKDEVEALRQLLNVGRPTGRSSLRLLGSQPDRPE